MENIHITEEMLAQDKDTEQAIRLPDDDATT